MSLLVTIIFINMYIDYKMMVVIYAHLLCRICVVHLIAIHTMAICMPPGVANSRSM